MPYLISGQRTIAHPDLFKRARQAAAGFASLGIATDDTIALFLRNDFAIFEASYAATLVGALPAPVNWHSAPPEFRYVLEDSGARVLVAHADLFERVRHEMPPGVHVFIVPTPLEVCEAYAIPQSLGAVPANMVSWPDWISGFEPRAGDVDISRGSMIYTSGTTGKPKGVRRLSPSASEAAAIRNLRTFTWGLDGCDPKSVVSVMTGPMYHSATTVYGLTITKIGAKLILQARFDAEELLSLIASQKVTHLHMVPVMFKRLLALPPQVRARYDLSSLRCVAHGAAPVDVATKQAMIEWWGSIFSEYYGGTEAGIITRCSSEEWCGRPGTVGKAVPGARVAILDREGRSVPTGEIGEVAVRLDTIADFTYHGDEVKRARAAGPDGLIALGDIGYLDQDGFLFLCDRSADIVISGGVNIYPAEIEAVLSSLEGVADSAVIGIPDEEYGETLCALIQTRPGYALTPAVVEDHLRGKIASFKIPKRVEFRETLPREDTGKIFKRKLREEFWSGRDRRIG